MKSIYLIRGNDGKYKIGIAKNPQKRLSQLQTGNSDELKIIDTYHTRHARKIESILHNYYSYGKQRGEWFILSIEEENRFKHMCENIEKSLNLLCDMVNEFIKI